MPIGSFDTRTTRSKSSPFHRTTCLFFLWMISTSLADILCPDPRPKCQSILPHCVFSALDHFCNKKLPVAWNLLGLLALIKRLVANQYFRFATTVVLIRGPRRIFGERSHSFLEASCPARQIKYLVSLVDVGKQALAFAGIHLVVFLQEAQPQQGRCSY